MIRGWIVNGAGASVTVVEGQDKEEVVVGT